MYPHERSLVSALQGRPFALLGVNTDDELETAKNAVAENNLNWRSWYDGSRGKIVEQYAIQAFPTIFLVDHTGMIRFKNLRGEALEVAIELLVAEAEAAGMKDGPPRPPKAIYRVFTSTNGQHTAGTFKSYRDGVVTIEKKDGTEVTFDLKDLSKKDVAYLQENRYFNEAASGDPSMASANSDSTPSAAGSAAGSTEPGDRLTPPGVAGQRPMREFVDSTGKFKTQARFVRLDGDNVVLEKADGTTISVRLEKLSSDDQDYIRDQVP